VGTEQTFEKTAIETGMTANEAAVLKAYRISLVYIHT